MKKYWKVLGIVTLVAILGLATIGAVALAQDSGNGTNAPFNFREKLHDAIANALGISVDQLDSAVDTAQQQVLDEAVTSGALTQDQADRIQERADEGWGMGFGPGMGFMDGFGPGMGRGFGRGGFMGGPGNSIMTVAADQLGMTVSELMTEMSNGKSIADLAAEKGVDTQAIVDAFVAQLKANLDQAVTDGRITQAQADTMLQQAQENAPDMLDNTYEDCMPGGGFHGGRGPGRFQQQPSDPGNVL